MGVVPSSGPNTKNVRSVWFVVKRRGCCCNLSGGVALIVWFAKNAMCVKNSNIIYAARASNRKRDCEHDLYCCLLPRCEALHTCRSGFPIATQRSSIRNLFINEKQVWRGNLKDWTPFLKMDTLNSPLSQLLHNKLSTKAVRWSWKREKYRILNSSFSYFIKGLNSVVLNLG